MKGENLSRKFKLNRIECWPIRGGYAARCPDGTREEFLNVDQAAAKEEAMQFCLGNPKFAKRSISVKGLKSKSIYINIYEINLILLNLPINDSTLMLRQKLEKHKTRILQGGK